MGLTLYEKGKAAMKADSCEEALLLLLEADHDFRNCNSQLLNVVDNYALLNLDIVWCYLRLKVCDRFAFKFPSIILNIIFPPAEPKPTARRGGAAESVRAQVPAELR